jgi:hypothetical protein
MRVFATIVATMLVAGGWGGLNVAAAEAGTLVGVNVVNPDRLNDQAQDELITHLKAAHVTTVRVALSNDRSIRFIEQAYQQGIGTDAIISPASGTKNIPVEPKDPAAGYLWARSKFSGIDPEQFDQWFAAQLGTLEAAGIHLTALEFGNEINSPDYDGDFLPTVPKQKARVLGLKDLNNPNDAEAVQITTGYKVYLKALAKLRDTRNHSKLNASTPILSAGMADPGAPGPRPKSTKDWIGLSETIWYLRQNGLDNLVDAYAVHQYPAADPTITLAARISKLQSDVMAACTKQKPCWVTEWGFFDPKQTTCPIKEDALSKLVTTQRAAYRYFADQGRISAILLFSWSGDPWAKGVIVGNAFECGSLTHEGSLALAPM